MQTDAGSSTSYDEVLYPSYTHAQTHPDQMAMKATLFGMEPACVQSCRILEVGCGDGTNLISIGLGLPDARLVGVDLAEKPIEHGRNIVRDLGLSNVSLHAMSVMDISPEFGTFDYIIAHGVYSWLPENVRDKVMAICKANMAPSGVAQISYNVHPGGHLRDMVREMMLYHVRGFATPDERVHQAIALVKFLGEAKADNDPYRQFLRDQFEHLSQREKSTVYHDELSDVHHPVWFHEFCEHAARHGLQFLVESDYLKLEESSYAPATIQMLRQLSGNRLAREQYLDFLCFRRFRQTLLCHDNIPLRLGMAPEKLQSVHVSSPARPMAVDFEVATERPEKFVGERDSNFEIDVPFAKAALLVLAESWPRAIPFLSLVGLARERLGRSVDQTLDAEALKFFEALLQIYVPGLVRLHVSPPIMAAKAGERPVASPLARWQAARTGQVTGLRHTPVTLETDLERDFLKLLDGTRDREALRKEWDRLVDVTGSTMSLDSVLDKFCRLSLLVS
jgi:methyltransferase-like protein/cyclopropane fatty-acyl-phospholipid synthase-like methyltransferase